MAEVTASGRHARAVLATGAILLTAGVAFIVLRAVIAPRSEVDFRFFWLAGRLWAVGLNPYGADFAVLGRQSLPPGNGVLFWFYPPQWWPICRALALLDLPAATAAWRLVSGATVIGSVFLLTLRLAPPGPARPGLAAALAGYAALIEPTANLLSYGQSTAPILLGLTLLVLGFVRRSPVALAAAAALMTLKPQIGALLLLLMLYVPRSRGPAIWGAAVAAAACLPQLLGFGLTVTVRDYLANLAQWGTLPSNTSLTSSGPLHLVARLIDHPPSPQWSFVALAPFVAWSAVLLRRAPDRPLPALLLFTAALTALAPLHAYDMTLVVIPLLLAALLAPGARPVLAVMAVLCVRPAKLEALLAIPQYSSGVSAGLIVLTAVTLSLLALAIRVVSRSGDCRNAQKAAAS